MSACSLSWVLACDPFVQIIRGKAKKGQLPPLSEYLEGAQQRLKEMAGAGGASAPPSSFL